MTPAPAPDLDLDLDLQLATQCPDLPSRTDFARWIAAALTGHKTPASLTLRIVDRDESAELNLTYRGKDGPTNVLSFPFECPPGLPAGDPAHALLGDLAVCAPLVAAEAEAQGKPAAAHWAHLTVHGTLHLLGHDHGDAAEAEAMEALETEILTGLGFPPPYDTDEDS